jgi:aerobic carbon-monoxide dehydrogenase medium subunit
MKPPALGYVRPRDMGELLAVLAGGDVLLAGGQSLLPQLNARERRPRRLVDLGGIAELNRCDIRPDHVVLGALTRHHDLASRSDLRAAVPVLACAAGHVGHAAVRTRGTLGGSIANADPAAELPGVCALLEATVTLRSPDGAWQTAVLDLLRPDGIAELEVIVSVEVRRLSPGEGWGFRELSRPGAYAFPLVTVAATLRLASDGTVAGLHAAVTGAARTPYTLGGDARDLLGAQPSDDWAETVAGRLAATAEPADDQYASAAYRRRMVRYLARGVLADARRRAVPGDTA